MTRRQYALVVAALVALFLFLRGPVWRHPWDLDASIGWSYAPIPLVVAAVLLASRRFAWGTYALDTTLVTLAKFGVTYSIAIVVWATAGEPPRPYTPWRPAQAQAAPRAPAGEPAVVLENAGGGWRPGGARVPMGGLVAARSRGGLHTLRGELAGATLFNVAVPPRDGASVIAADRGLLTLTCTVHRDEPPATLIVE